MPKVTYVSANGESEDIDVSLGENVMRGALYNNIEGIVGECGGALSCATCHCYIDDAWLEKVGGPSSDVEEELLEQASAEVRPSSRLSCQIEMTEELDGLIVRLPESQY